MSLATRCSECGTMFRVVQDQLRVSEGWVRCGRCDTVFNALDALVDLDAEAAIVTGSPAAADPQPAAGTDAVDWPPAYLQSDRESDLAPDHRPDQTLPASLVDDDHAADEFDHRLDRQHEATLAGTEAAAVSAAVFAHPSAASVDEAPAQWPAAASSTATVAPVPKEAGAQAALPGFIRQAERNAHWTSPAMRAALIGAASMLSALLAMQAVYHFRDEVAARSGPAGQLLRSACVRWGCRIEAPRRLNEVMLESHALSRVPGQPRAVKLLINLRNRGRTELALPSIDLSLTDAKGQLIARRALLPSDFRIDPPVIARGAELPLEMVLGAGEQTIVGYTVELFYP